LFDLTTNYFALFGLEQSYSVDRKALKASYLQLQREVHPDNFVTESDAVQRDAMQRVSYLNQAYETLLNPVQRAIYLLQTNGHEYDADVQIHNDGQFLLEQMELREELALIPDATDPMESIERLRQKAEQNYQAHQNIFAEQLAKQNWEQASAEVGKMMFACKLLSEISEKEAVLFD